MSDRKPLREPIKIYDLSNLDKLPSYSLTYLGTQLEIAQKSLAKVERTLEGKKIKDGKLMLIDLPTENERLMLERELAEQQKLIKYLDELIKLKGGIKYSPDNIQVGDWIFKDAWYKVYRVNKTTVSIKCRGSHQYWFDKCKYFEIRSHCPKEKAVKYGEKYGIDLTEKSKTHLGLSQALVNGN